MKRAFKQNKCFATFFAKKEILCKIVKSMVRTKNKKQLEVFYYQNLPILKKTTKTRIKNFCLETSRTKGIVKKLNISRHVFRERASFGLIAGLRKSVW